MFPFEPVTGSNVADKLAYQVVPFSWVICSPRILHTLRDEHLEVNSDA